MTRRPLRFGAVLLLPALLSLAPREAAAGGFSNLDFGIRRMAMFAVTALPDDGTAIFHNPAGLTLVKGTSIYHHQTWILVDLGFKMYDTAGQLQPDHEIGPSWNVGAIPFLGVASDFGVERLRAAVAVYVPNAYGAVLPKSEPTRYHVTKALFAAGRATAGVAYDITDQLSIGATVSFVFVYLTAEREMSPRG